MTANARPLDIQILSAIFDYGQKVQNSHHISLNTGIMVQ